MKCQKKINILTRKMSRLHSKTELMKHMGKKRKSKGKKVSNVPIEHKKDTRRQLKHIVQVNLNTFKPPISYDERLKLLQEYIEWSFTTTSNNPIDFPLAKRINPYHFFQLRNENELFANMIEFVKYNFASRLENNPIVSPQYTTSRIRYYDKEFGAWVAAEVSKAIASRSEFKIEMPAIPNCESVPERKRDDD